MHFFHPSADLTHTDLHIDMKRGEEIKAKAEDRGKGKEEIDRGEREEGP